MFFCARVATHLPQLAKSTVACSKIKPDFYRASHEDSRQDNPKPDLVSLSDRPTLKASGNSSRKDNTKPELSSFSDRPSLETFDSWEASHGLTTHKDIEQGRSDNIANENPSEEQESVRHDNWPDTASGLVKSKEVSQNLDPVPNSRHQHTELLPASSEEHQPPSLQENSGYDHSGNKEEITYDEKALELDEEVSDDDQAWTFEPRGIDTSVVSQNNHFNDDISFVVT